MEMSRAGDRFMPENRLGSYAGDVSVEEAWEGLRTEADAVMVDVRTQAEWNYVGVPALDSIGKSLVLIEWQTFPTGALAPRFVDRLTQELSELGVGREAPLYFICRSGSRSRSAAIAMTAAGFARCFNVGPGFEGPIDEEGHRSSLSGWKLAGLPWKQT
jgi:rhodanese-related sulfurtransferase